MKNGSSSFNGSIASSSRLADDVASLREEKPLLLMTHQIIGYPDFETNYGMLQLYAENGVDLVELQLPFSEPIADGPVFLKANQAALAAGVTVEQCLAFAARAAADFGMPVLLMTYYNILYRYGVRDFIARCAEIGVRGLIVPDAIPEESAEYFEACAAYGVDPVLIATPYTPDERLKRLARLTGGMLYCAARKGVTGAKTAFTDDTSAFLERARRYARTPLAVGFGVQQAEDIRYLRGKCDIAIIGTKMLQVLEADGLPGVKRFLASLRDA